MVVSVVFGRQLMSTHRMPAQICRLGQTTNMSFSTTFRKTKGRLSALSLWDCEEDWLYKRSHRHKSTRAEQGLMRTGHCGHYLFIRLLGVGDSLVTRNTHIQFCHKREQELRVEYVHRRSESASEYLAGSMEGISLLRQLVEIGGGDCCFKCGESNTKSRGTGKIKKTWHHQRITIIFQ